MFITSMFINLNCLSMFILDNVYNKTTVILLKKCLSMFVMDNVCLS